MGRLAEQYGYRDGGECLTVADKRELWFFEITGAGSEDMGALWVARRIPDDHVTVSAIHLVFPMSISGIRIIICIVKD